MKIALLFRKKTSNRFSIEELFHSVYIAMKKKGTEIEKVETVNPDASVASVLSNLSSLKSTKYKLVHITGDVNYMVLACRCPSIFTIHDVGSVLNGGIVKRLIMKIIWFWLPGLIAKRITVISENSKIELLKLIPFAKNKIRVIFNPISPLIKEELKDFNKIKPIILQIGTKDNKNVERSIRALEGINCEYVIIGKLENQHFKMLKEYNISFRNKYNLSYEEIIDCYKNSDIVLFASLYEGFGMPIIEAQKTGRAVITSKISSMPEIAGYGACLVDPLSVMEINAAIKRLIKDDTYRENLIESGRENVKRFQIDTIVEQYLDLYKEILD